LQLLVDKYGQVVSYQELEKDIIVSESSLRALMLRLRKKLPGIAIQNSYGIGIY
jgi:DNA-binding winged helix-turn-helix (wHTH) protein